VLTGEEHRYAGGHPAEHLVLGVEEMPFPVGFYFFEFGQSGFLYHSWDMIANGAGGRNPPPLECSDFFKMSWLRQVEMSWFRLK
jgi:hypothetical protein